MICYDYRLKQEQQKLNKITHQLIKYPIIFTFYEIKLP